MVGLEMLWYLYEPEDGAIEVIERGLLLLSL